MKNKDYLFFVSLKDCLFCGKGPLNQAHHIRNKTGIGRKPSDYATIPLCYDHHDLIHNDPKLFYLTTNKQDIYECMVDLLIEWLEKSDLGKGVKRRLL